MLNTTIFTKRLQELMSYYEISASKLADSIGIQRSSISHLLSGRNKPSLDFILKILDHYPEVSFDWLVKGKGNLENQESSINTPTLFDNVTNKKESTEKREENKTVKQITNSDKSVEKVILLYEDGSFKEYH
jgi:transcriptional regulator with XRE-family HTH domain